MSDSIKNRNKQALNAIDLFSSCVGLSEGLKRPDLKIKGYYVE